MEQLNRLIRDASNEFECHNFKTSLSLYVRCIEKCQREKFPSSILHNLKSSEAALRTILGEYETALAIVNEVLDANKHHWLCLLRRSQIFKKQNKYKKALRDLDTLTMYAPDNMQVAALKIQLKGLMIKPNQSSSSEDIDESQDEVDEEELLKFSGLKKIDRTSFSIMVPKARQSRVTLCGDTAYFYQETNTEKSARKSSIFTPKFIREKLIEIQNDLEAEIKANAIKQVAPATIKTKNPGRNKSILKNRDSKIYFSNEIVNESKEETHKFAERLRDIEGKVITSETESLGSRDSREVNFRKSIYGQEAIIPQQQVVVTKKKPASQRKSCLKRCSFSKPNEEELTNEGNGRKIRRSKFQSMSRSSIDGKMIRSDKKDRDHESQGDKENANNHGDDDTDSEGSQYNIYGSKKVSIPRELKQNLGWSDSQLNSGGAIIPKNNNNSKKDRTKSILKKDSVVCSKQNKKGKVSLFFQEDQQEQQTKKERKVKKSVMFNAG